jgi:di/tripeptidase
MPALERLQVLLLEVFLLDAAVHLERADGGDDHRAGGLEAGLAALDVEELLGAEIGAEAGFGHHVVGELERGRGREHRVAAVRDVGERAAVDEGRRCSRASAPGWARARP